MAIAPVLKTGVRKDLGVRIPRPPLGLRRREIGAVVVLEGFWKVFFREYRNRYVRRIARANRRNHPSLR